MAQFGTVSQFLNGSGGFLSDFLVSNAAKVKVAVVDTDLRSKIEWFGLLLGEHTR
jgi:hypothetical protein